MLRRFAMVALIVYFVAVGVIPDSQRSIAAAQITATPQQQPAQEQQFIALGANQVYLVPVDGSKLPRQLTRFTENLEVGPLAWSPGGGQQIAFIASGNRGGRLYIMDADGSHLTNLTPDVYDCSDFTWSPDGEKIAFVLIDKDEAKGTIYVMNADGSSPTPLTDPAYDSGAPEWSPDGQYIVYAAQASESSPSQLYIMGSNGANATRLTKTQSDEWSPTWSPDGKQIAFVSERQGKSQIYLMNADGTNQVNLTNSDFHDAGPGWSPDGKHIAFRRIGSSPEDVQLYVINPDGSHLVHVEYRWEDLTFSYQTLSYTWSPDSQRIALAFLSVDRVDIYVADISCIDAQLPCTAVPVVNLTNHYRFAYPDYDFYYLAWTASLAWSAPKSRRFLRGERFPGQLQPNGFGQP